jgi:bifunctional NMN adenylyltransferase/nudix hydrolase
MTKNFDLAVFIGRVQPFHVGHYHVIQEALTIADHVVVLVGSARSPRCHRNPFTFAERKEMIQQSLDRSLRERVIVLPLEDVTYNDAQWVLNVQRQVEQGAYYAGLTSVPPSSLNPSIRVTLVGHSKDNTSYYLKLFPQWHSTEVSNCRSISGTNIRNSYFSNIGHMWVRDADGHREGDLPQDALITPNVQQFLTEFMQTPSYKQIRDEYEFVLKYKSSWASAPWPVTFVTVDSIVVQSGHVLMVKRGALPGKGQWALPGGFINQNERIRDAVIRELREETQIKVPEAVLRGSIVAQDVFDDPNRSSRGRTITHAFLIKLRDDTALPRVKGSDDAEKAKWIPISELRQEDIFEDHWHLIMNMLARI